jgi:hypothetical protein
LNPQQVFVEAKYDHKATATLVTKAACTSETPEPTLTVRAAQKAQNQRAFLAPS